MQAKDWQQHLIRFLQALPPELHQVCQENWQQYRQAALKQNYEIPNDQWFLMSLWNILAVSDYALSVFVRHPEFPIKIYQSLKDASLDDETAKKEWQQYAPPSDDLPSLMQALRVYRHFQMTRILWRLIAGHDTFAQHLQSLVSVADTIIVATADALYDLLALEWGIPVNDNGEKQPFIVLALGKLGGKELNFSSDVDLVFCYPQSGVTVGKERSISNEQFFTKLGQHFIRVLSEVTQEGFVFRVDMRLRPHGQSGNLVLNFSALENYYQYQGRDWERYALVKARVISTDINMIEQLQALLQPFVYRRYLDYGAFSSLREMRELVEMEVKRKNKENDLKLGKGGIRQIEFLTQSIQLIRGGREPQFREQNLLKALSLIVAAKYIKQEDYEELLNAYLFLREVEHCLQMINDAQTHALPKNPVDRARLYSMMAFSTEELFKNTLKKHTINVTKHFNLITNTPHSSHNQKDSIVSQYKFLWTNLDDKEAALAILQTTSYEQPELAYEQLSFFKNSRLIQSLKKQASARLDKVMPALLLLLAKEASALTLLSRMLRLLRSIVRRSAYLALLIEQPHMLKFLVTICGASEWILVQICSYPVLLDELLSPPSWQELTSRKYLKKTLTDRMQWIDANDLESQMEHLRQFKLGCFLSLAALELLTDQSLDVTLALSDITEVILQQVHHISLDFMIKHYELNESIESISKLVPFGIIAYGKLGARELNYASDLDLVFLYDAMDDKIISGKSALTPAEFSLRLAQRIIHMLSVPTATGILYEVDVRLRPAGSAGLLVSHLNAYRTYLHQHAWTWEHQALIKARCIIGPKNLRNEFEECRAQVLKQRRSKTNLVKDIEQMREKMHEHRVGSSRLDLKTMPGGIADLEFVVQFLVLQYAHDYPELLEVRSTVNLLPLLAELNLLDKKHAQDLLRIYNQYQVCARRHFLQAGEELNDFTQERALVRAICDHIFQLAL
ncbi:MAG: bifunctional [glutamate--ammonia ligase]-adenylyl-L-tyrosine phosphorylase/[glutamate--ammonia-ligase] adenylyltransferase [Candidatus Berkiella sp.]